jgi:hypothetical protein
MSHACCISDPLPSDSPKELTTYPDPTHVRKHEIKIRVNDDQLRVVDAVARLNKRQRAVLALELMFEGLEAREQRIRQRLANGSR